MNNEFKLTKQESQYVQGILEEYLQSMDRSLSFEQNMTRFVSSKFLEYTPDAVQALVGSVQTGVTTFQTKLQEAMSGDAEWFRRELEDKTQSMTNEEKLRYYMQLLAALKSLHSEALGDAVRMGSLDLDQYMQSLLGQDAQLNTEAITDATVGQVRDLVTELAESTGLVLAGGEPIKELLTHAAADGAAAREFVRDQLEANESELAAALATVVAFEQGETPSIPAGTSPEFISATVAAGIHQARALRDGASGRLGWEKVRKVLRAIGLALVVCMTIWVVIHAAPALVGIGTGLTMLVFGPSILTLVAGIAVGTYLAIISGTTLVNLVVDGYEALGEFMGSTVIPTMRSWLSRCRERMDSMAHQGAWRRSGVHAHA